MKTSFEVGAIFKIINKASPTLTAILRQVRALNEAIEKARLNLEELGKGGAAGASTGLTAAIDETKALAVEWRNVATNAAQARKAIGSASSAAVKGGASAATVPAGRRHRHQPAWLSAHATSPGFHMPGVGHVRLGGAGAAGLGLLGYGAYQAAEMEDFVTKILYTEGMAPTAANKQKFRDIIQKAMSTTGYSLHDIGSATLKELQMMQGTPGGGVDILPELLRAASTESRMKGSSLDESITALIGLAHMTKSYDPKAIAKLIPAFAFLSTANPSSLNSMERAASYAVPMLQSGMDIDPLQSLLLGTALTRAGANATKSGTWLRNMMLAAMPGTSLQSETAFEHHEAALQALGLVDDNGKPTWFTNGKPDPYKMLEIAGNKAQGMSLTERAGIEKQLFGAQGSMGFSLLADPKVREQIRNLNKELYASGGPEAFMNRYANWNQTYYQNSPIQQGRTALAQFEISMMNIGEDVLPAVSDALKDFKGVLEGFKSIIPGASTHPQVTAAVGKRALEGAVLGAGVGAIFGGIGAGPGAVIGAVGGGVEGTAEMWMRTQHPIEKFGQVVTGAGKSFESSVESAGKSIADTVKKHLDKSRGGVFPGGASSPVHHISLSLNLDGRTLAEAMSQQISDIGWYPTGGPTSNGSARWADADDYSDDT